MDTTINKSLGYATVPKSRKSQHTPSKIQADTLFTFTSELKYLLPLIENKAIPPRYCPEDIKYLKIGIDKLAYPMRCFCDINLHRIDEHLSWYGYYGLALTKEWGMKCGIQPVQYINPKSRLVKDFRTAFKSALKSTDESKDSLKLQNYLLHELMYYKPYEGKEKNRNTQKLENKCFTDECEWRYIADVSPLGYKQVYQDENILTGGTLQDINDAIANEKVISLPFTLNDLKYIIIKTEDDFNKINRYIHKLNLDELTTSLLLSKIIIWDLSKGDF